MKMNILLKIILISKYLLNEFIMIIMIEFILYGRETCIEKKI